MARHICIYIKISMSLVCWSARLLDNTEECSEIEVDSNPNSARQKTSSQKRKDWQQYALTLLERQPLDESAEQLQLKQKEDATLVDLWREAEAGGGVRRGCCGIRMWTG